MYDPVSSTVGAIGGLIQGISSLFGNKKEEEKEKRSAEINAMKSAWSPWLGAGLQPGGIYQAEKSSVLGDVLGGFTDAYDQTQRIFGMGSGEAAKKAETALKTRPLIEAPQAHQLELMNEKPEMISSEAWDAIRKQRAAKGANPWLAQIGGERLWG